MLIQLLIVVTIIGILYVRPSFDNIFVTMAFYGGLLGGLAFLFWYAGRLSGGIADALVGGGMKSGKADQLIHLAERHEHEKEYEAAVDLYEKAITKDRRNPAPRVKLAELYLRLQKYDLYLQHMKNMLQACPRIPMSDRCTHMNRMADICLHQQNSPKAAIEILSQIIKEFPHSKYALYAKERIEGLR
jgi:tetratricopeptide (TPR) repeat protein